jgi:sugar lactone lactonase YvrE
MNRKLVFATIVLAAWALPMQAVQAEGKAGDKASGKAFPRTVPALAGAPPEGFTIGKGATAYNSSIDGSIYKVDLRSGKGEVLVAADPSFELPFSLFAGDCYKLGMRVDPRSNYLFVAGCQVGNAMVFDADTGEEIADYTLAPFGTVINDLAITRDAVYFTDFSGLTGPLLYRLPLSGNGRLPESNAILPIALTGDFATDDQLGGDPEVDPGYKANGIVATPNGKTLIVGNSNNAQIYRVDPATGHTDRIAVDPPLVGFIDGIVLHNRTLYILTPFGDGSGQDWVQVVDLDKEMLTGTRVGVITDPDMDGVASGAMFGNSLYVNNARYTTFPESDTEYWLTRLNIKDIQP